VYLYTLYENYIPKGLLKNWTISQTMELWKAFRQLGTTGFSSKFWSC